MVVQRLTLEETIFAKITEHMMTDADLEMTALFSIKAAELFRQTAVEYYVCPEAD